MDEYLTRFDSRYLDDPGLLDRAYLEVYGVFGDTYALFVYVSGDGYSDATHHDMLHGYPFIYPTLQERMYVYHDGRFYQLMEITDEQLITKEEALVVYTNYTNRNNFLKPEPGPELSDTERASIQSLFEFQNHAWYLMATTFIFDEPAEIDLELLFYNGIGRTASWKDMKTEEKDCLLQNGFDENVDVQKMNKSELEAVLNRYFGLSLADVQIPEGWVFYAPEDAYYTNHNGAILPEGFVIRDITKNAEGRYTVSYETDSKVYDSAQGTYIKEARVMLLQQQPDGSYQILLNRFC